MYSVQILQCLLCAVYSSCGVCSVKCTGVQCIVYTVSVVCAVYSVQCILYIVQFFAVHMSKPVYCSEQDNISNSQEWQQDLVVTHLSVHYLISMTMMIRTSQVNLLTYFIKLNRQISRLWQWQHCCSRAEVIFSQQKRIPCPVPCKFYCSSSG